MRHLIILFALFTSLSVLSQNSKIYYNKEAQHLDHIEPFDTLNVDIVYQKGRDYIVELFSNRDAPEGYTNSVQLDDPRMHKLHGHGLFEFEDNLWAEFDLEFEVKDGRYRLFIDIDDVVIGRINGGKQIHIHQYCNNERTDSRKRREQCFELYYATQDLASDVYRAIFVRASIPQSDW